MMTDKIKEDWLKFERWRSFLERLGGHYGLVTKPFSFVQDIGRKCYPFLDSIAELFREFPEFDSKGFAVEAAELDERLRDLLRSIETFGDKLIKFYNEEKQEFDKVQKRRIGRKKSMEGSMEDSKLRSRLQHLSDVVKRIESER